MITQMGASDDDEEGRFGDNLRNRRRIRKLLNFEWNTTDPNLMLNLPTKIKHTKEMIDHHQQQQLEAE